MDTDIYFGIDFGTTNSSMARYDPEKGVAKIILNAEGEEKTPSLVYFGEEDEILVGKDVSNLLEEVEDSDDQSERDDINLRVVNGIKRKLNDPVVPIPGGKTVRPVEVVAEIIKKLKQDAEGGYFHDEIDRVVLTYPATFGNREQKMLREAAEMAGFGEVELVEEPTAAAIAFSRLGRKVGNGVLVYDLGAGTFDLSMVTRDEEGSFYVSMEPQGDPRCGGNDFDLALYRYCDEIARKELGRPISLGEETDLAFLGQCCKRKENLSSRPKSRFGSLLPSEDGVVRFRHEVLRKDFEELIRERVEQTVSKTASMLERAKARGHEVDAVVLIGGSSRVPLVRQRLKEALPVEPVDFSEKDYAVALGAAYHAYEMWKPKPKPADEYRKELEASWLDERLSEEDAKLLMASAKKLGLKKQQAEQLEREVMGATIETILERQRRVASDQYRKAVTQAYKGGKLSDAKVAQLKKTAAELGLSAQQAAAVEREVMGGTRKEILAEQKEVSQLARARGIEVSEVKGTGKGGSVTRRDIERHLEEFTRWRPHSLSNTISVYGSVTSVAINANGQVLASGHEDGAVKLWNPHTGELVHTLAGGKLDGQRRPLAFSPDGRLLAYAAQRYKSGKTRKRVKSEGFWDRLRGEARYVEDPTYSYPIKLLNVNTGELLQTFAGHPRSIKSIEFSPDGETVASCSDTIGTGTVRLWNAQTGKLLMSFPFSNGHLAGVHSIAFSPDANVFAFGGNDHNVYLWKSLSKDLLCTLTGHGDWVKSVTFSPNGYAIASGSRDATVKLWDIRTGKLLRTLTGHEDMVNSVAFSPDGRIIASGSRDKTLKLWDTHLGELLQTLTGHSGSVRSIVFSPDGQFLVSGSEDGTVKVWGRG